MTEVLRRWTFAILWVFTLTIPWEAALVLPSIGTLSRAVGLLVVPIALLALVVGGRRHRLQDAHLIMVGLAVWTAVSVVWSIRTSLTVQFAGTMVQLFVMVLLLWEFGRDGPRQRQLLWAFVLGALVGAVTIFHAALTQQPVEAAEVRLTQGGLDPNLAAFVLSMAIPIAWYLSLTSAKTHHRWLAGLYVPVGAVAAVFTGSRGGLLTLTLALSIVPLTLRWGGLRLKILGLVALAISVGMVATFVPTSTIERLGTIPTEVTTGDIGSRRPLWEATLAIFASDPITGVGAGASRFRIDPGVGLADQITKDPRGPHNTYLSLAGDLGVVGLGLFLLLLMSIGGRWLHLRGRERQLVGVLLIALVVGLIPVHQEYDKITWLLIAILVAEGAPARPASANGSVTSVTRPLPDRKQWPATAGVVG